MTEQSSERNGQPRNHAVARDWGVFVPAIVWVASFVQCLIILRWRGLWFRLGPPAAFLAIIIFIVAANPVVGHRFITRQSNEKQVAHVRRV